MGRISLLKLISNQKFKTGQKIEKLKKDVLEIALDQGNELWRRYLATKNLIARTHCVFFSFQVSTFFVKKKQIPLQQTCSITKFLLSKLNDGNQNDKTQPQA